MFINLSRYFNWLNQFIDVPTEDPDDARRRKFLNVILLATIIVVVLTAIAALITSGLNPGPGEQFILLTSLITFSGSLGIYFLNRLVSGRVASILFLLLLMGALAVADTPYELIKGRSLFLFMIPIIISSVLLGSGATIIFYVLSALEIFLIAYFSKETASPPAIITFLLLTLLSWISSRSLEQALRELRDINTNLDQIVKERTHALAESLTRERIEAGRSQAILESIADGVIVFDTLGNAIQANPALSNLIAVPINSIVNSSVNTLVEASPMDAKNRGKLAGMLTRPGKQYTSQRVEWGHKTISISSSQVLDRDGSEVGTVAVFRDFTREAELEKMKSAFVAMVSHELRTPLSAILGYAEIFMEQIYGPMNEKQLNMTNRIVSNTKRLLSLINDLLDQAQMEAGKLKVKYDMFKPSDLLENLHSVMDKLTADKGLKLNTKLDPNLPESICGDNARLQQILVNLVNNAVKFTQAGSIDVQLARLDEGHWGISVADTGQGIPQEDLPFIFDTFRQVEGTTTRVHGGFGLGLSIVKQLVNLMGGTVSVESELGKGSTFSISLPLDVNRK